MAEMRPCEIKKGNTWQKDLKFHRWGFGSEEGTNGDPNIMWSIGIVEEPNGQILEVSPEYIKFTDRNPEEKKNGRFQSQD